MPIVRSKPVVLSLVASLLLVGVAGCDQQPTSGEHFERAVEFEQNGDTRSAVIELKNTIKRDPKHLQARWRLAKIYLAAGDGAGAQKELAVVRKLGKTDAAVQIAELNAMLLERKYQAVLGKIATSNTLEASTELLLIEAETRLQLRQLDRAKALLASVPADDERFTEARRAMARIAIAEQDFDAAKQQLAVVQQSIDTSVSDKSDRTDALLQAEVALREGNQAQAQAHYQRVLDTDPTNFAALIGLARSYIIERKGVLAYQTLAKVKGRGAQHSTVHYYKGVAAFLHRDFAKAEVSLARVLKRAPNHTQSLLLLGASEYAANKLAQAEEHLAQFLKLQPDHTPGRKLLAAVQLKARRADDAMKTLGPIADKQTDDAQLLALIGTAQLVGRDVEEGKATLKAAANAAPQQPAIRTQLALSLLASGENELAITELEEVVKNSPEFSKADLLLVYAHLREQDFDAARDAAAALIDKQPESPTARNLLATALAGLGDREGARQSFEAAIVLDDEFLPARFNLARMAESDGELGTAREHYLKIRDLKPDHPAIVRDLARLEYRSGRPQSAIELLEAVKEPSSRQLAQLASYQLTSGEPAAALLTTEKALALNAEDTATLLVRAYALQAVNQHAQSLTAFRALHEKLPNKPDVLNALGDEALRAGDSVAAKNAYEKLAALKPDDPRAAIGMARLSIADKDAKKALSLLASVESKSDEIASFHAVKGDAFILERNGKGAYEAYSTAFRLQPNRDHLTRLATLFIAAERSDEAIALYEKWLEKVPKDHQSRIQAAQIHERKGERRKAVAHYKSVLEYDPNHLIALNNLAWVYSQGGSPQAEAIAERAYKVAPDRGEIQDTYGWILVKNDKVERGLALLKRAVQSIPDEPSIQYHYASALAKSGDKETAKSILDELLSSDRAFAEKDAAAALASRL